MFDQSWMRRVAMMLAAFAAACAAYLLIVGRIGDSAILLSLVMGSLALLLWQERLPSFFVLLFTFVAAVNGSGYAFDLWQTPVWFDEVVHIITPFVVVSALAWLLIRRDEANPLQNSAIYFGKVGLLGLLIGFAWEGFEYTVAIVGDRADTISDLAMDFLGAIGAAAFCLWAARHPATQLD